MTASEAQLSSNKPRIEWMDVAKGIAIILVVLGHTLMFETPIVQAIYSFHMPLFFLIAGYTFRTKDQIEVIKASAKQLLIPYCLLFVLTKLPFFFGQASLDPSMIASVIAGFFFADAIPVVPFGFEPVGILWFLWALFLSRIILNFFTTIFEKNKIPDLTQLILYFILAAIGGAVSKTIHLPFAIDLVASTVFLMYIGYLIKKHQLIDKLTTWPAIGAAFVVWCICLTYPDFANVFGTRVYASLAAALAGTLVCIKISMLIADHAGILKQYLVFMGANSMIVFFLHTIEGNYIAWGSYALLSITEHSNFTIFILRMILICGLMALLSLSPVKKTIAIKPQSI